MSDTKISLNNEVARIKQIIDEKEKKRNFTEPAAIPSFDREIRQLKRQLQNVQEAIEIQARGSEAGETQLDEITKAKTLENKLYEEAVEAGIDFNNHDNPMLVSIHRLGLSIELVDILTDAANLDKEREEKFPDIWYFTEPLNNAIAAKEKCVIQAKEKYDDAEQKKMEIEKKLQASKENGDVENIIILTDQLEDAKKVVQCLKELLSAEEENRHYLQVIHWQRGKRYAGYMAMNGATDCRRFFWLRRFIMRTCSSWMNLIKIYGLFVKVSRI